MTDVEVVLPKDDEVYSSLEAYQLQKGAIAEKNINLAKLRAWASEKCEPKESPNARPD